MRLSLVCGVLLAGVLCLWVVSPGRGQAGRVSQTVFDRIELKQIDGAELMKLLREAGTPSRLAIGAFDCTVFINGPADDADRVGPALAVVDTALETLEGGKVRAVLRPVGTDAEMLREASLTLRRAGTARKEFETVVLEGSPEWVRRSMAIALRAELMQAGVPLVSPLGSGGFHLTVPAGVAISTSGSRSFWYDRARVIVAEGRIALVGDNGMRIDAEAVRISYSSLEKGKEKRLVIEPL